MAVSTVFHSINPPDNSLLSHCSSRLISAFIGPFSYVFSLWKYLTLNILPYSDEKLAAIPVSFLGCDVADMKGRYKRDVCPVSVCKTVTAVYSSRSCCFFFAECSRLRLSSVQDVILGAGERPYAFYRVSCKCPQCCPLRQFQRWADWRWPFQGRSWSAPSFLRLSPPGDRWWKLLGFVSAGRVGGSGQAVKCSDVRLNTLFVRMGEISAQEEPLDSLFNFYYQWRSVRARRGGGVICSTQGQRFFLKQKPSLYAQSALTNSKTATHS